MDYINTNDYNKRYNSFFHHVYTFGDGWNITVRVCKSNWKHKYIWIEIIILSSSYLIIFVTVSITIISQLVLAATKYFDTENTDQEYYGDIYMQIRESFITTKQSRRVICKDRRMICRLRIDKAIGSRHKRYISEQWNL